MKHQQNVSVLVVLITVATILLFSSSASADLGNHVNLPGLNFGYDTYQQYDGRTTFSSSLSTLDQIDRSWVSLSKDTNNPNQGYIMINFSGTVGSPVAHRTWQNSSMSMNYRGLDINTNIGIGAYQEVIGWTPIGNDGEKGGQSPIFGNWMSEADGSVTVNNVSLLSSTGEYNEYTFYGDAGIQTNFSGYAQFYVSFDSPAAAAMFDSLGSTEVYAVTPEPATLSLLVLGAIGLIRRRRQRS